MAAKSTGEGRQKPAWPGEEWVSVTLEPKGRSSDREVVSALRDAGASEVEALAPGFVSALVPPGMPR